jgi:predicted SAM-dependent methyltransferase
MPLSSISTRRPLASYAKAQALIGNLVRNRTFQLRRDRVAQGRYLDVGCGPNTHDAFINLDYLWHPKVDVCWDITRGLPFADQSMKGVFSEHCLEHFDVGAATKLFVEFHRVLGPSGILRLIVPDAELYLRTYVGQLDGDTERRFPFQDTEGQVPSWTPMSSVNRIFYQDRTSPFGHRTMYDFRMLEALLRQCGFANVLRREFGVGADPVLLIESPLRRPESLYVEATRGDGASL